MDKASLVISEVDEARQAVRALAHAGLPMTIAIAICNVQLRPWTLFIASPDIVKHGPSKVIRFATDLLKAGNTHFTIDDTFFVDPKDSRAMEAVSYLGPNARHRVDEQPKSIALRFNDDASQGAFLLIYDPRARASEAPPVANKAAIERAWAA